MKKLIKKINYIIPFLKILLFRVRLPVVISWALTYKCQSSCIYCGVKSYSGGELSTQQIFSIITEMKKEGVRRITFSGGEPLIREDIGMIIDYIRSKDIEVNMNTNCLLFKDKITEIKNLSSVKLSLDGPEKVNDYIRGKGAYKKVIEAIELSYKYEIPIEIITTLTSINIPHLDEHLDWLKKNKIKTIFQPATTTILGTNKKNLIFPEKKLYNEAIQKIIEVKRENYEIISNSFTGLNHLMNFPNSTWIKCASGLITARVEPDGTVHHCSRKLYKLEKLDILNVGFRNAFIKLPIINCDDCWCASMVELNLMMERKIEPIKNIIYHIK